MHRAITRLTIIAAVFLFASPVSAQVVIPQQESPSPAGLPSEANPAQQTPTPAGIPDESKKPPADSAGSTATSDESKPALLTRASANDGVRIGSGDLLQVSVFGASDYNHEVRVGTDGSINLPFIGSVKVAGLTPRAIATDLQGRLSQGGYFNNPQVSVFVKEYATQGVSVLGEVQKPGVYPLYGSRTLFDVLSAAQGTTQVAGDKVYITHRDRPQQAEVVKLSYDPTGAARSNVPVLPGDTVIVQKASMMYVVGNVHKPTGIAMVDPGLTVLKAIALAQGIAPNAALDKARLVRKTSDGQVAVPLQLKKMLAAQVPDMRVEPGDVLFIPNSAATAAFKKGLELALQTASGVLIYHQY
ncbi:MAG TPA: polysaccharide biosynthesis/export family protein [Candidatus Angelobacter sp.]|nr:polysaccharide biosynthesis/export family protein [Candidatus Angelobacter sp.]